MGRFGGRAQADDVAWCVGVKDLGNVHGLEDSLLESGTCVKGSWMDCIPWIPLNPFFKPLIPFGFHHVLGQGVPRVNSVQWGGKVLPGACF